jgi:hypothetical protein
MSLAAFADIAEIIGAVGVIAGLIFVGIQLHQNTRQMQRGEANSAMAQGSALRHLLLNNREAADLIFSGIADAPLQPLDEFRMNFFFSEVAYMTMHVWDRVRNGLAVEDELLRIVPAMTPVMTSPRGLAWWTRMRGTLRPDFVADLEALVPALKAPPAVPSAEAVEPAESAVARPADAG